MSESGNFHVLKILGGPHSSQIETALDGQVLKGVTHVAIECGVDDVVKATITMFASLEIHTIADVEIVKRELGDA